MNTKKKTNTKLTNEVVDHRLIEANRSIARIGDVINSSTKIEWKCTMCDHNWHTTPNSILNLGSGCPACAGTTKLTNGAIDTKLVGQNLQRIGQYVNIDTPIKWQCTKCEYQWDATPGNVLHGTRCPICSTIETGKKKSAGQYDRVMSILESKQVTLLSKYTRIIDIHKLQCNKCDHVWNARLNDIVNNGTGCPMCAGLIKLTNQSIDDRLIKTKRSIIRTGDVVNATTKISWQCQHNHSWCATPDSVLNLQSGCPTCGRVGFASKLYFERNPHKKTMLGIVYLIEGQHLGTQFIKVGITEKTVTRRFAGDIQKYQIREIAHKPLTLYDAYIVEQEILHKYIDQLHQPSDNFSGKTECLRYDPIIIEDILQTYFNPAP